MFRIFYRYSNKGNPFGQGNHLENAKSPLRFMTRRKCFENFISVFDVNEMTVIADNVTDDTIKFLEENKVNKIIRTSLGNSGSFITTLNTAINEMKSDDIMYIAEDDYLHLPDGKKYIYEGLQKADYVSLYDHLDKYTNPSYNPLVQNGSESTRVFITESIHWKYTNATTGCFAVKIGTLVSDYNVFMKYCQPCYKFPQDFSIFRELITTKNRILVSPIPGKSSHIGLEMSPFIDWLKVAKLEK